MSDYESLGQYEDDCKKIAQIARERGLDIDELEAYRIWDEYSDNVAAGWLILPEDEEIFEVVARRKMSDKRKAVQDFLRSKELDDFEKENLELLILEFLDQWRNKW
jgi:hypothetical protein